MAAEVKTVVNAVVGAVDGRDVDTVDTVDALDPVDTDATGDGWRVARSLNGASLLSVRQVCAHAECSSLRV
jgi:hypothetical protein